MDQLGEELSECLHALRIILARLLGRPIIQVVRKVRVTVHPL